MTNRLEPTATVSSYRWVVMGLWLFTSVASFMVVINLGILLPQISKVDQLNLSPAQQGLLGSVSHWGNIVLAVPLSMWTSRFGPKALTTACLALGTAALFLQGWAPVFSVLFLGRLLFGTTIIAAQPARPFLTQMWFQAREVVLVNGVSNVLFGVVVGGGLVGTPFILSGLGDNWRNTFYVFGAFLGGLTILWAVLGRERVTEEYRNRQVVGEAGLLRGALQYRDLWIAGLGFMGSGLSFSAFLSFYPTLMLEEFDVSLGWSGAILALGVLVGGVTGLWFGWMASEKSQERQFLVVSGLMMTATFVGMVLTGNILALMIISFWNGIAWAFFPILFTVPFLLRGIRHRELAIALAVIIMMLSIGQSLGPIFTGYLQEATGSLKLSLFILSFSSLSLCFAGLSLRYGRGLTTATRPETVSQE